MTIDWIEVAWATIAFLGVAGSAFNWREVWIDLKVAPSRLHPLGRTLVRAETVRLAAFICFLLAGVGAVASWHRVLIIGLLIAGNILLMVNTWLDRVDRRRLLKARRR